ncbi:MAG: diacylglycerol kinase, partial [Rickettsiales bacterium]|nr:diacylglycerol kinase [Rickettsiales bacterium]
MKHERKGLMRILAAFRNSRDGFAAVYRSEEAFRQELWLAAALLCAACAIDFATTERLFLISAVFAVLFAELVNTAIEFAIDRISTKWHPLSKIAKDIGS